MDVDNIKKIIEYDNLTEDHTKYLYIDKYTYCCNINLEPIFTDIRSYDYIKPIKKLFDYYKDADSRYYLDLYNKYNNYQFDTPIYIKDTEYDTDEILLQYIKCFPKMSALIIWPIANIKNIFETRFYEYLQNNGIVHGIKEINLTKKQIQGAIYQIYYDKSGFKDIHSIKGKQNRSEANNSKNKLFIIFYEANNSNISGKDAPEKIKLRELLRDDSGKSLDTKLNFFLHITDNHTQTIEIAQLFCNRNSLRLLQHQRLDRLFYRDFYKSLILFMTYKNWLYQEIKPLDQIRFMALSGIVLFSLGLRNMSDLDLMVLNVPENPITPDFLNKFVYYLEDDKTRFPFLDGNMKGRKGWYKGGELEYRIDWFEREWPNMYGAESMDDTILNPKFHYYFFGIKLMSMKADVKRRLVRNRPAAYADLIALQMLTGEDIKFDKLPEGYWKNHIYYKFTEKEITELQKKIVWYLRKRYSIHIELEEVKKIIHL